MKSRKEPACFERLEVLGESILSGKLERQGTGVWQRLLGESSAHSLPKCTGHTAF